MGKSKRKTGDVFEMKDKKLSYNINKIINLKYINMSKIEKYPLKEKIIDFLDNLIAKEDQELPAYYVLENFAIHDFKKVDFALVVKFDDVWKEYELSIKNDFGFNKVIYSHNTIQYIKQDILKENFDFLYLLIGRREILYYYENPLNIFDLYQLYESKNNIESNVDYRKYLKVPSEISSYMYSFNNGKSIVESFIDDICEKGDNYEYQKKYSDFRNENFDKKIYNFIDHFFNEVIVYKFVHFESSSLRRRDTSHSNTEYCLFFKGIRIVDGYCNSLLKDTKRESFSEYNDSIPGSSSKKISFKISYSETEIFKEKYNFKDHLLYLSKENKSRKILPFEKINYRLEYQEVFHEFGHLVGWEITNMLGYNFGKIKEVNLFSGSIKTTNNLFSPKKFSLNNSEKKIGAHQFNFLEIERVRLNIAENKERAIAYIIYLISGALFNMYFHKIHPEYKDFEEIFINEIDQEQFAKFRARAGSDYSKVNFISDNLETKNKEFIDFKFFALELFYIFDRHFVFQSFTNKHYEMQGVLLDRYKFDWRKTNYLPKFNKKYNGEAIRDEDDINDIFKNIRWGLRDKDSFIIRVRSLINKYAR